MRVLITSSSFLDTPGKHLVELSQSGLDVIPARGPLTSERLREAAREKGPIHGIICGEDDFDRAALQAFRPHLKAISKYGVGLDRIDSTAAIEMHVPIFNTPGANHATVTELTFGLLLALTRNIPKLNAEMHDGIWQKMTGRELSGKTLGIFGFGRVGREVAVRALSFGMRVLVYNSSITKNVRNSIEEINRVFTSPVFENSRTAQIIPEKTAEAVLRQSDIVSLHMNLTAENRHFFNRQRLSLCPRGAYLLNVSRAGLVVEKDIADFLVAGHLGGYAADVVDPEPITHDNPLLKAPNVILTPHIGSRTVESVERQGLMAVQNLLGVLRPTRG